MEKKIISSIDFLKRSRYRGIKKFIKTRFSDVLGIYEFKDELMELVDFLKNPGKYHACGAKLP